MDAATLVQELQGRMPGAVLEVSPFGIVLRKEEAVRVFALLKDEFSFESLQCLTAVDRKAAIEVVYHVYSFTRRLMVTLKVVLPMDDLQVASVTGLWSSANWFEREVYDLFGVTFQGHPDLCRILNPESWTEHPLRKDFKGAGVVPRPVK